MIEREELLRIAKIKGLSPKNSEKDYLLEIMLFILGQVMGKKLIFKGGTALYKLQSLNRFSEDLDFTLNSSKIKIERLTQTLLQKLKDVEINGKVKEVDDYQTQKNIKLELKGPLFNGDVKTLSLITLNISLKEKPVFEPEQRILFSQYPDIPSFSVFVMPLPEMLAEKVRAIFSRNKARDVYDLWFLVQKGGKADIHLINKKLRLYKEQFEQDKFMEKIDEKRNSWEMDLGGLILGNLPEFNQVRKDLLKAFS